MFFRLSRLAIHLFCTASTALWVGGLTFYGAFVLPRTDELFGRADAALVTREVSRDLNFIGLLSLSCWVIDLAVDWSRSQRWVRTGRLILLLVTILILVWLFPAHDRLGRQVDAGLAGTRVFYLQHRNYLIAISVQWGVNLLLLAVSLASWTHVFGPRVRPETLPDRALTAPSLSLEWTHQSSSSEDSPPL